MTEGDRHLEKKGVIGRVFGRGEDGLFERLKQSLKKTRDGLVGKLGSLVKGKKTIDDDLLMDIEELLIEADMGVKTATEVIDGLKQRVKDEKVTDPEQVMGLLRDELLKIVGDEVAPLNVQRDGLTVVMVVGVNGTGKTTTIGKLAAKLRSGGAKVMIAAGDTFRAAAIDQLEVWAGRAGVEIIKHQQGSDPAAVAYDAVQAALSRRADYLLIDTAGRLHIKTNLMEELKKIKRVVGRELESAPHEVLLVLDAATGQNGISQARLFGQAVDVTGIVLTKLDGTAKGGIAIAIKNELSIPIKYVGVGESVEDLREFNPSEFVEALFE